MAERVHVVSLSGGRDSAAVGIWAAREHAAGRIGPLRYVTADVGSGARGMEPELRGWLALYEHAVLLPLGLGIEFVSAKRADQADYEDGWATVYERKGKRPVLPGPLFRTCTWRLKIEPIQKWRRRAIGKAPVTWIVGFRADEGSEKRRVQTARFADERAGDEHWRPFVELGWGLPEVRKILASAAVPEPAFYDWTSRSGCVLCFYKPKSELAAAAERHPATFKRMADLEEAVIRSTGKRGSSPWVVTRGGTLREVVAGIQAQGTLDIDERRCGDPLGTCLL